MRVLGLMVASSRQSSLRNSTPDHCNSKFCPNGLTDTPNIQNHIIPDLVAQESSSGAGEILSSIVLEASRYGCQPERLGWSPGHPGSAMDLDAGRKSSSPQLSGALSDLFVPTVSLQYWTAQLKGHQIRFQMDNIIRE